MNHDELINLDAIDWEEVWQKSLKKSFKKEKNWDDIAKDFGQWLENDDYPDVLLEEMRIDELQNYLRGQRHYRMS